MEPAKKRTKFVLYSDQEIQAKQDAGKNKNTTKTEQCTDWAFRKFLTECGETNTEYWNYEEPELDFFLCNFWFGARKDPDSDYDSDEDDADKTNLMYSANTMKSFRYALNRILKFKGHEYDIMNKHSLSFKKSQQAFFDSQKELKALGKAEVKSAPEITEDGKQPFNFSVTFMLLLFLFQNLFQKVETTAHFQI